MTSFELTEKRFMSIVLFVKKIFNWSKYVNKKKKIK